MLSTNIKYLDTYKEIEIGNQKIRLPKFSLGQLIEFSLHYRMIEFVIMSKGNPDYSDVFELAGIHGKFNDDEKHEILIVMKDWNYYETKAEKTDSQFDEWVAAVVVTFGESFGWTQNEILSLKPEAINEYLKQLNRRRAIRRVNDYSDMMMAFSIGVPVKENSGFERIRENYFDNLKRDCGVESDKPEDKFDEAAFNALAMRQRNGCK